MSFEGSQQCGLAYHGRRKCTSFKISKSLDKTEHEEDEEESTLDYNLDENDSNGNQDAEIFKTEKMKNMLIVKSVLDSSEIREV